jgi:hypothetical protein
MDVIAGLQAALDITGKLRELSKKLQDADFSMLLADLTMQLADTKLEIANLKSELAKEREEKERLSKRLSNKEASKPVLIDGGYKFDGDDALYCTGCFDSQQKKIRLGNSPGAFAGPFGKWRCPVCKTFSS